MAASAETIVQVRPAAVGDATDVALLLDTLGYPCSRNEAAERIVGDRRHHLLLAEVDGAACGLISLNLIHSLARGADIARITALVVSAKCERQGIGRACCLRSTALPAAAAPAGSRSPAIRAAPGRMRSIAAADMPTGRNTS